MFSPLIAIYNFEKTCCWREDVDKVAGMAMRNEIRCSVPTMLKPFTRKLIVSILV